MIAQCKFSVDKVRRLKADGLVVFVNFGTIKYILKEFSFFLGEIYQCDPQVGCICKDEKYCKGGQQIFSLSPLASPSDESPSSSVAAVITVVVLFIALLCTILGVWYYKRRTRVLEKDLQNRSVYYVENSILDPLRHQQVDLIAENPRTLVIRDDYHRSIPDSRSNNPVVLGATANVPNNLVKRYLSKKTYRNQNNI